MIKFFNNFVSSVVFFLVYITVYYLFGHQVPSSSLLFAFIFFILLVLVDVIKYDEED